MTFRLIEAERAQHAVSRLCAALGVTRQGFYDWRRRRPCARTRRDEELTRLIRRAFEQSFDTYGAPRIHAELRQALGQRVAKSVSRG